MKHDVPPHRPKPAASGLRWPSATGPPEGGTVVAPRCRVVSSLGLWSPRPHCLRIIPRRLCDTCAAKRGEERARDRMFSCPCFPVETLKEHVSDFVKINLHDFSEYVPNLCKHTRKRAFPFPLTFPKALRMICCTCVACPPSTKC